MPCNSQNSDIEDCRVSSQKFWRKNIKVDLSNTYNGNGKRNKLKIRSKFIKRIYN